MIQLFLIRLYTQQEEKENSIMLKERKLYSSSNNSYSSNSEQKKVVLSMVDDKESSSKKSITNFNDIQNLNKKYNKNTYRAKNGRFASVKNSIKNNL